MSKQSKQGNLVVFFEDLNKKQMAIVAGAIDALGQHTAGASYLEIYGADRTDLDLLCGLAATRGRLDENDPSDPDAAVEARAWREARRALTEARES